MKEPLTPFWAAWRVTRIAQIAAAGYPRAMAKSVAAREARNRMCAARLVGRDAALDADLITIFRPDGTFSVHAKVERSTIASGDLLAAEAWASSNRSGRPN